MANAADPYYTEVIAAAKQSAREALEEGDDEAIKKAKSEIEKAKEAKALADQAEEEAGQRYDTIEDIKRDIDNI